MFQAGEGSADITPPLGVELAGFHKPEGKERTVTGVRQTTGVRVLLLKTKKEQAAIVSLDLLGVSRDVAQSLQTGIGRKLRMPAKNVRVCATHSHSAPTLVFLRQWGAVSDKYRQLVETKTVEAAAAAQQDLVPADVYIGQEQVVSGNHNRTSKSWKTDADFGKDSGDDQRWLDTKLCCLYFQREPPKRSLVWYQFSAHSVCYTDGEAGPDWPGLVAKKMEARDGLLPSFLQGHCGDVNPGDGATSLGDPEKVSEAVYASLHHAVGHSEHVPVEEIRVVTREHELEFDMERFQKQLETYRSNPAACTKGEWVDAGFAQDWFESASKWKMSRKSYRAPISVMHLGELPIVFHPAELYSVYGLTIRRDSPAENTIVVGYCDDMVGYVTDPKAYENNEYAAIVVPKILGWPPFKPDTGRKLAAALVSLLRA